MMLEAEEITELRLGLPVEGHKNNFTTNGKRAFAETTVDLKLNLSSSLKEDDKSKEKNVNPANKAQVVGWPPVRSLRKSAMAVQKKTEPEASLVKVSMDGAPYLRKVDLNTYKSYQQLYNALDKMFNIDLMNEEGKRMDLVNGSDRYVPTYEDNDGDWMLVGDVPWEMFVESCKRLRIVKGTDVKGLAPKGHGKNYYFK